MGCAMGMSGHWAMGRYLWTRGDGQWAMGTWFWACRGWALGNGLVFMDNGLWGKGGGGTGSCVEPTDLGLHHRHAM